MYYMGTITINVGDESEAKFRKAAKAVFGTKKGSLGKAASEAFEEWSNREIQGNAAKMLDLLEKGFKMGKVKYRSRDELHER